MDYNGERVERRLHETNKAQVRSASDVGSGTVVAERLPAPLPDVLLKRLRHSV